MESGWLESLLSTGGGGLVGWGEAKEMKVRWRRALWWAIEQEGGATTTQPDCLVCCPAHNLFFCRFSPFQEWELRTCMSAWAERTIETATTQPHTSTHLHSPAIYRRSSPATFDVMWTRINLSCYWGTWSKDQRSFFFFFHPLMLIYQEAVYSTRVESLP